MRIISASLIMLALIATEPAFAGCGSHGVYRSRSAKASIVVKKVVKREAPRGVLTAAATLADKPKPTLQASVSNATVAEALPAKRASTRDFSRRRSYVGRGLAQFRSHFW